jgi:hypothetical protein
MNLFYILVDKNPVPVDGISEMIKWFEESGNGHALAQTLLPTGELVSTVFLGVNHGFGDKLILFETMIFGGDQDLYRCRYSTYDEAMAGHQKAIELIFEV